MILTYMRMKSHYLLLSPLMYIEKSSAHIQCTFQLLFLVALNSDLLKSCDAHKFEKVCQIITGLGASIRILQFQTSNINGVLLIFPVRILGLSLPHASLLQSRPWICQRPVVTVPTRDVHGTKRTDSRLRVCVQWRQSASARTSLLSSVRTDGEVWREGHCLPCEMLSETSSELYLVRYQK